MRLAEAVLGEIFVKMNEDIFRRAAYNKRRIKQTAASGP